MPTDAPGLRTRKRKDGEAFYWVAAAVSRRSSEFRPATVRLYGATDEERAARCRTLTNQLLEWLGGRRPDQSFDGTIGSLIRIYQSAELSPYRMVKHATRKDYDHTLGILDRAIGSRRVDLVTSDDVMRWYFGFRQPATEGGPERLRRAHGCMKMLRIVVSYGKGRRYEGCKDLREILSEMQFELPPSRDEAVTFEQAKAVVEHALEIGRPSIALAQALQFECSLRQVDAIGYWEPAGNETSGIVDRGLRWSGGVTWQDVSPDLTLKKRTTKNAARGEWDLTKLPLVMLVLSAIPPERRVGPMVINEATALPYVKGRFPKDWRKIARAVGIPDHVHNRDSRAGGITEGDLAGADPRDLQNLATHSDQKTTWRYIRSTTRRSTDNVAELRVRSRTEK